MNFLIIGAGSIGQRHLRNFLRIDGVRCSIAEVDDANCEKVAAAHSVDTAYADYRDADLAAFDGVVICAPSHLHVPIALDVVSAGTHVLTEKPLSVSHDGIAELKQLRDSRDVLVSVAYVYRHDPLLREIRDRKMSGEFGPILMVNVYAGQYWPAMRKDYPPAYAQSRETGGGAMPDHLVHLFNYLEWLFGVPKAVSAKHWRLGLQDIATEDAAVVTLQFGDGVIAQLGVCLCQRDTNMRMQVIAESGTLQTELSSDAVNVYTAESGKWVRGRALRRERDDLFRDQAQHFIDCIRGETTPICTVEEAEQTMLSIDAALQSADGDGRFVRV